MYWILGVAAVVGVFAWLSDTENNARLSYEHNKQRLTKEMQQRHEDVQAARRNAALRQNFEHHLHLYRQSVATANLLYAHYAKQKQLIATAQRRRQQLIDQILPLKEWRDSLPKSERSKVREQLSILYEQLEEAKAYLAQLHAEKQRSYDATTGQNAQTHELKTYIANHCGYKGKRWYSNKCRKRAS